MNVVSGVVQPWDTLVEGQARITQDQYVQIVLAQLTQLWSNCLIADCCVSLSVIHSQCLRILRVDHRRFALSHALSWCCICNILLISGELAEVWFDGGYPNGTADPIAALFQQLQPNAVAFQGS